MLVTFFEFLILPPAEKIQETAAAAARPCPSWKGVRGAPAVYRAANSSSSVTDTRQSSASPSALRLVVAAPSATSRSALSLL